MLTHFIATKDNRYNFHTLKEIVDFYIQNHEEVTHVNIEWDICEQQKDYEDRVSLKILPQMKLATWKEIGSWFSGLPYSSMYDGNAGEQVRQVCKSANKILNEKKAKAVLVNDIPYQDIYVSSLTTDPFDVAQAYSIPIQAIDKIQKAVVSDVNSMLETVDNIHSRYPLQMSELVKQSDIIRASYQEFLDRKERLAQTNKSLTLVFASDIHIPYHRKDAVRLLSQIIQYTNPHWITGLNDFLDMEEFSRWDKNDPRLLLWTSEGLKKPRMIVQTFHSHWLSLAPNLSKYGRGILGLTGNHDKRVISFLLENNPALVAELSTGFLQTLYDSGMLVFSNHPETEPVVKLSDGLKVVHGISSSSNPTTASRKTIEGVMSDRYSEEGSGIYYNVVSGHLHRSFTNMYNGVTHWNAGCHSTLYPKYLKTKPNWQLGCVVIKYDPNGRYVHGTNVVYDYYKGNLIARYDGVEFSTPFEDEPTYEETPTY